MEEKAKYKKMYHEVHEYGVWSPGVVLSEGLLYIASRFNVKTVLDAGCGRGQLVKIFSDKGYYASGVDITLDGLTVDGKFYESSLDKLLFDDSSFDMVISIDVLEHIPEQSLYDSVNELSRVCGKFAMIQVCTVGDSFGSRIGETLHETVKPSSWWLSTLSRYFNTILLEELGNNAVFYCEVKHESKN